MSKTILVVEDNEMNMKLFCDILESQGYKPLRAYSGMAALQLASAHDWALAIVDIQLPDVSGLDVVRAIKRNPLLSNLPILAVTAFTMKGYPENIVAVGSDRYMKKPISVKEFIATVAEMLTDSEIEDSRRDLPAGKADSNDQP